MKLTFLFLLLPFFSLKGQDISYSLYIFNQCENRIEKSDFFSLTKDSIEHMLLFTDDKTLKLPSFGIYELDSKVNEEIKLVNINKIVDSDTLIAPRIIELVTNGNKQLYIFSNCDEYSHGLEKSYYTDGSLRMIGNFKDGLAIGELKRFYENGEIKEIANYSKRGFKLNSTEYHRNGEIKKISIYNKKVGS